MLKLTLKENLLPYLLNMESSSNETIPNSENEDSISSNKEETESFSSQSQSSELTSSTSSEKIDEIESSSETLLENDVSSCLYSIQQHVESIDQQFTFFTHSVMPLTLAITVIVIGCSWFYKTFVKKAL